MLIDVKYTRDWQLGLKKNLQDSAVKPIYSRHEKGSFPLKIYLINMSNPQFYPDMFTFTK